MMYQFDVRVAMEYGVEEAVLIQNIYFWVKHNEVNNTNFHDGRYWTFNSAKAFTEIFPFWNEVKIKRMLKKLEEKGALLTGNYNKIPYDRTKWYTLSDKLYSIVNDGLSQSTKLSNEKSNNDQPIPDINTDKKPVNKTNINNSLKQDKDIQDIQQDTTTITTDNLVDKTVINNSKDFINYFCNKYYSVYSTKYIPNYSREGGMVKNKLLKQFNSDTLVAIIDTFIDNYSAKWAKKQYPYPTIGALCSWAANDCLSMINNSMNKNTKTVNNYAIKKNKEDSSNFLGV